jgi:hypothetical protein
MNASTMDKADDTIGTKSRPSTDSHASSDADASIGDVEKQSVHDSHEKSPTSTDEKTTRDPNIVDWDGPDDPENPKNWATRKKVMAVGMASMITFLS